MTLYIIIATCIVSFAAFQSEALMDKLIFNPYRVFHSDEWHRLLTSGFIHADWIHLFVNMFVLYSFGTNLEILFDDAFGEKGMLYFGILYFGGILVSIVPTYNKQKNNPNYNALGASGAVSAVLFSFILFRPFHPLLIYGIIPVPGLILGVGYLAYSYYAGKKAKDNVNHDAHFWGAVFGVALTIFFEPKIGSHFLNQLYETHLIDLFHR